MITDMRMQTIYLVLFILVLSGCKERTSLATSGGSDTTASESQTDEPTLSDEKDAEDCGPLPDAVIQKKRAQEDEAEVLKEAKAQYGDRNLLDAHLSSQEAIASLWEDECPRAAGASVLPQCVAVLADRDEACKEVPERGKGDCLDYRNLLRAHRTGEPGLCAKLSNRGAQELCKYTVGASFSCPPALKESFLEGCKWVLEHGEKPCEGSAARCSTASFVQAVKTGETSRCDGISNLEFRGQCKAMVSGDRKFCSVVMKESPSCRTALLGPPRLVKASTGWESHLYFKNRFDERASCLGVIAIYREGKSVASVPVQLKSLLSSEGVKTVKVTLPSLVGGESFKYDGSCQWFYAKGPVSGAHRDNGEFDE